MPLERFLSIRDVCNIVGGKTPRTIYRWMDQGIFPKPVSIGPNSVGWPESDIKGWAEQKKQQSNA